MKRELWDFWMRHGGNERDFFRLKPVYQLPHAEQLFCAIVREDKPSARSCLNQIGKDELLRFLGLLRDNGFAGFIWTGLLRLGLLDVVANLDFCDLTKVKPEHGIWLNEGVSKNLQRLAILESDYFQNFSTQLEAVSEHLASNGVEVLWSKGNSLARSIYAEPSHRLSSDFDIIVKPADASRLSRVLAEIGYAPIFNDPGFCHQLEVGPADSFDSLFSVPSGEFVPSAVIGFARDGWPLIDVKFNVLDRGLNAMETARIFSDAEVISLGKSGLRSPSKLDHLLISLVHAEKDRYVSWKSLVDIHLLCEYVSARDLWTEFSRRAIVEGITLSAWAGLCCVKDRFVSRIPADLIDEMEKRSGPASRYVSFVVEPLFYWNGASVVSLFLNACYTGDRKRKLRALTHSFSPGRAFLSTYYSSITKLAQYVVHILVLIFPAVMIRKTFGKTIWPRSKQYRLL